MAKTYKRKPTAKKKPAAKTAAKKAAAKKRAPAKKSTAAAKKPRTRARVTGIEHVDLSNIKRRHIANRRLPAVFAKELARTADARAERLIRPPVNFTPELGLEICRRIANGESLNSIAKDPNMPARGNILVWALDPDKGDFPRRFHAAQEIAAYGHADDIHLINRNLLTGRIDPQSARVISDNLRWVCGIQAPRRFGKMADLDELLRRFGGASKLTIEFVGATDSDADIVEK